LYDRERERREAVVFLALLLVTLVLVTVGTLYIAAHVDGLTWG
jgi:hypothetical protein